MMYRNQCTAKEKLMNRINEVSFAVNDVLLYLDTHPCCEEAISFYQECEQERQKPVSYTHLDVYKRQCL